MKDKKEFDVAKEAVHGLTISDLRVLIEEIRQLQIGNIKCINTGICNNLKMHLGGDSKVYKIVSYLATTWEDYSGTWEFPIAGYYCGELWDGEQLRSRKSLLKHMESELEVLLGLKLHEKAVLAITSRKLTECLGRLNKMLVAGPEDCDLGICSNASSYNDTLGYDLVSHFQATWEHTTGSPGYPVPRTSSSKWEGKGLEYRTSLIKHIILNIEKLLCDRLQQK